MELTIIGSGGCVSLPKPLCNCNVCIEARIKGIPYSRYGCSLYIEDIKVLIDTPEDIVHSINNSNISAINGVIYSHLDPDHTLGFRIFEQLKLNWFDISEGKECDNPLRVLGMSHVIDDIYEIKSKHGPFFDYYENVRNLIKTEKINREVIIENITITFVKIGYSTIFVFEEKNKKIIYAPCDVKPFPNEDIFNNADVLIIGDTIIGEVLKNGYILSQDNPLRNELFVMKEIVEIKAKYNIKSVIITHIEEDWGKSYDDYLELEKEYNGIRFAYDGMKIKI